MLYCTSITIPPNTPKGNPIIKEIEVKEPVITTVSVYFPPGHACLTGVAIFYGEEQISPAKNYDWLRGNDESVNAQLYWISPIVPCRIKIKAFNEDTTYTHTVYIRVEALPVDIALWHINIALFTKMFSDFYELVRPRPPIRI